MKTGEWLKNKRIEHKLTQNQLAESIGVSVHTIAHIERGERFGSVETWNKIENFFDSNEPTISFFSNDLIEELKDDILEFGENHECILVYKIINNNIVFTNYDFVSEEKPFDEKMELKKGEKHLITNLKYALEVFENQNKLF